MWIANAYAQGTGAGSSDVMLQMMPIVLMFALLYFLMIRPQMKRQKEHKAMLDALQKGDEVVAGGILGKVVEVGDSIVSLEISKTAVIQVQRQSITTLLPKGTLKSVS